MVDPLDGDHIRREVLVVVPLDEGDPSRIRKLLRVVRGKTCADLGHEWWSNENSLAATQTEQSPLL